MKILSVWHDFLHVYKALLHGSVLKRYFENNEFIGKYCYSRE